MADDSVFTDLVALLAGVAAFFILVASAITPSLTATAIFPFFKFSSNLLSLVKITSFDVSYSILHIFIMESSK